MYLFLSGALAIQLVQYKSKRCRPVLGVKAEAATKADLIPLGSTDLRVSRLGIGTLQWGDPQCGFGAQYDEAQLAEVFKAAVEGGVNFFDTAEVYGYQGIKSNSGSEQIVGRCRQRHDASSSSSSSSSQPLVVGTKFFTVPWTNALVGGGFRLGRQSMIAALRASLARLGTDRVDLYQVHFPFPAFSQEVLSDGLAEAVDLGLTTAVGVCNYNAEQLEKIHGLLGAKGVPLATNQVKYSILERGPEASGLLAKCRELGIQLVAHSPLEQGLLTSKYVEGGAGAKADSVRGLLKMMQLIGTFSGGKTVTQVALNYLMQKGAIPIPGCKTVAQAQEHVGALGWALEENEIAMIDEKADFVKA
ncbi:hypothetical protein WJX72_001699 [[Myrmecia] bisecta]|uniref:NADP-dependent oxidoreductase domain-containing protein n=1 Tax=[Myrmecia] bisecta TaxID=41462 RepID=A0AAW1P539_9CHLO